MLLDLHWRPPERAAPHVRHSPPVAGEKGSLVDSWEDGGYLPRKKCFRRRQILGSKNLDKVVWSGTLGSAWWRENPGLAATDGT